MTLAVLFLAGSLSAFGSKKLYAFAACVPPAFCPGPGVVYPSAQAALQTLLQTLTQYHVEMRRIIKERITREFIKHEDWLTTTFFEDYIKPTMQSMTQQLTVVTMHQTAMMGMFLDAKQQLETQRLFQELQVEAQRDYQPSEDFCWFGTAARSLSATDSASKFHAAALNARQMKRHLRNKESLGSITEDDDKLLRFEQFRKNYCNTSDNGFSGKGTGLEPVCKTPGPRPNMDVDFTRLIEDRRTLNVAFKTGGQSTPDEQDVLALGNNLYGHDAIKRYENVNSGKEQELYMALRALTAKRNVAENSFNAIVAMKSSGSDEMTAAANTSKYLGAILGELGVPPEEIKDMIGEKPSYYAQLEILAKKIYQNPDFFANLYDTPANVARKGVALKAIEMMIDRAIYESQLRQEMVTSVLLAHRLRGEMQRTGSQLVTGAK